VNVIKTADNVAKLLKQVDALTKLDVLVGIPAETTGRDGKMNNATIAYIHEFGSPAQNIPARPFLRPGVKNAREDIAAEMEKGAKEVLKGGDASVTLNRVGMIARNSVVKAITNPNPPFAPLSPVTIRNRLRKTQAGRRQIKKLQQSGQSLSAWAQQRTPGGGLNIQPLLDTLQMRNAITYVIREAKRPSTGTSWGYQKDYGKIITKVVTS